MSGPIYMERNKSFIHTFLFFELESCKLLKNNFLLSQTLTIYCFLLLTKYSIFYKILWEKKVLQRVYILRVVQARKDNQQRWLGCCILRRTCRNYLSNYTGYTIDGTICLKIVTWSTPHLHHLFLVKSNCVISKENSGIISPLFLTPYHRSNSKQISFLL